MALGGAALKFFQTFLYFLCFCCSVIILGLYSYFLAAQSTHHVSIPQWQKAVEGMSGIGVVYTIFAVILTCFLGGKTFFAFLAVLMDVLLCAAFVAIAILTRHGVGSCSGSNIRSPLGNGPSGSHTTVNYAPSIGTACRLNKVCFAVAVIGAFLFLFSALVQVWLGRHHQKEKRYGPSPSNNYTAGSGGRWFKRKRGPKTTHTAYNKDAELGAVGAGGAGGLAADHHTDFRPSHETGTTVGGPTGTYTGHKYDAQPTIPTTGGYHTGPTGSSVNPYGYENTHHSNTHHTTGTNF